MPCLCVFGVERPSFQMTNASPVSMGQTHDDDRAPYPAAAVQHSRRAAGALAMQAPPAGE